ncbi:MAG: hypothetical protein AAF699_13735, partial [Pseudomonadota bacterium]
MTETPATSSPTVSLFRRANQPNSGAESTVEAVLGHLRTGRWVDAVAAVRAEPDKDERRRLKLRTLPAIAFSGTFEARRNDELRAHSGFVLHVVEVEAD